MLGREGQLVGNDGLLRCTQANSSLLWTKATQTPISDSEVGGKKEATGWMFWKRKQETKPKHKPKPKPKPKHSSCENPILESLNKLKPSSYRFLLICYLRRVGWVLLPSELKLKPRAGLDSSKLVIYIQLMYITRPIQRHNSQHHRGLEFFSKCLRWRWGRLTSLKSGYIASLLSLSWRWLLISSCYRRRCILWWGHAATRVKLWTSTLMYKENKRTRNVSLHFHFESKIVITWITANLICWTDHCEK